jgi:hypothetical protein
MMHCAYDTDAKKGLARATKLWPNSTPSGPDPEPYLKLIGKYADAGFTHVYMHQIGDNQDEFAAFAAKGLMPKL